jgi:hypothetical protein
MATNSRNQSGRDYQSWGEARRQQDEEQRDRQDADRSEAKVLEYLRSHPSASWAEANYKTNRGNK